MGELPAGSYEVTITGTSHVEHKNLAYRLSQARNDFTVLEWGSCNSGHCYDDRFDDYFPVIARWSGIPKRIFRWAAPPREIWVINEPHVIQGHEFVSVSPEALDEFLSLLSEVNTESIPEMFCGLTGPLPILVHAPIPDRFVAGVIIMRFGTIGSFGGSRSNQSGVVDAGGPEYYAGPSGGSHAFTDQRWRSLRKYDIAHELFHVAFAGHAFDEGSQYGLMYGPSTTPRLSPEERLAACIVYHPDTHPGNTAPDTNPN